MAVQSSEALERISRADEARKAAREAETEQLRSGLLLSLSHDLRTPLAGILGSISSLREPSLKLTAIARADLLMAAEEETRRLSRYVDDLLALTRLKSGLKPDLATTDAIAIAEDAVARARALHPAIRYAIQDQGNGLEIRTDAALLAQALFNLLDNAARHGPADGRVTLELSSHRGFTKLTVTDEGPGVDPAVATHIFDPLFRGKDSAGAGLGLAIVKSAVTVLGGSIEMVSPVASGRGTSFIITLPDTP
jgi:two-component system, OmpR family, sensor histidine kinase KdpD